MDLELSRMDTCTSHLNRYPTPSTSPSFPSAQASDSTAEKKVKFDVDIEYLPFQLDPTLPEDHAVGRIDMYRSRFGSRADSMLEMMKGRGNEVGIRFQYSGSIRGTVLSHRLISKSYLQGGTTAQLDLIQRLFQSYFEQNGDPGDVATLARLAGPEPDGAGIFPTVDAATAFLQSDELRDQVTLQFDVARRKGISGVPHFEIEAGQPEGKRVRAEVGGAQDKEAFLQIFEKMAERF